MKNYILVRDAITDGLIVIKKDMICTVEACRKYDQDVSLITFTDCRREKYVKNDLLSILQDLNTVD